MTASYFPSSFSDRLRLRLGRDVTACSSPVWRGRARALGRFRGEDQGVQRAVRRHHLGTAAPDGHSLPAGALELAEITGASKGLGPSTPYDPERPLDGVWTAAIAYAGFWRSEFEEPAIPRRHRRRHRHGDRGG